MMELNESTYYYKPKISREEREQADAELSDKIEYLQAEYSCWGYRTLKAQLLYVYALLVNGKKIRRVMKKYGLFRKIKRRFVRTTDSNHPFRVYPNLLLDKIVTGINRVWVADITYIRIMTGFVFLAVIVDIFSRRVIGWAISKRLDHRLTVGALKVAIETRKPEAGLIHHSDGGVQYACKEYVRILEENKIQISMAAKGNPYQNAYVESFFKTLKNEEVYLWEYKNFTEVVERIPQFIEEVYNKKRVHSGIKYLSPEKFESILQDENRKKGLGHVTLNL